MYNTSKILTACSSVSRIPSNSFTADPAQDCSVLLNSLDPCLRPQCRFSLGSGEGGHTVWKCRSRTTTTSITPVQQGPLNGLGRNTAAIVATLHEEAVVVD
jgi:hypothetical protein